MEYPTMEQAIAANHEQVCVWHRYLPSPGINTIDKYRNIPWTQEQQYDIREATDREEAVNNYLFQKWKDGGGFNPELSKKIGFDSRGPYISSTEADG